MKLLILRVHLHNAVVVRLVARCSAGAHSGLGSNPLSHVGKCLLLEPIYLHHLVVVLLLLGFRPYTAVAVGASLQ